MIIPLFHNMLWLLLFSIALPLVAGIIGHLFFFKPDHDDSNHTKLQAGSAMEGPEPEPKNSMPWQTFEAGP